MKKVWIVLLSLFLLTACAPSSQTEEILDFDRLFADLSTGSEEAGEILSDLKAECADELLDYLMQCFLKGELNTCQFGDGSAATEKFYVWESMLGGESISLEAETPYEYWEEWCDLARRTCDGVSCTESWHIAIHRYLALIAQMPTTDYEQLVLRLSNGDPIAEKELEQIKKEEPDQLLRWLMGNFLAGSLEGCQLQDGSIGTTQFEIWSSMLGGEGIESIISSPQQYWDEWSGYAKRIYDLNGMDFLQEQGQNVSVLYIELLDEQNDDVN